MNFSRRILYQLAALLASGSLGAALMVNGKERHPAETNSDSPDARFARDMSAHHAQAVEMSVTMLKRASDPAVKLLAQDVALTQQAQIGQMGGWLMAWNYPVSGQQPPMSGMNREAMGMASIGDVAELEHDPVGMAEGRYLTLMRKHHQGGVNMAKSALKTVQQSPVKAFAERIVASQTSEIRTIDAMLKARNLPIPADLPAGDDMDGMGHE